MIPWAMTLTWWVCLLLSLGPSLELPPAPPPELPEGLDEAPVGALPAEAVVVTPLVAALLTKGFRELPPAAFVRSKLKLFMTSCCCRFAEGELDATADPLLRAQIHDEEASERLIEPPFQDAQLAPEIEVLAMASPIFEKH